MEDEYRSKVEAVLGHDEKVNMILNGDVNELINSSADVTAQIITDFSDSWDAAKKTMESVRLTMLIVLKEYWNDNVSWYIGWPRCFRKITGGLHMDTKMILECSEKMGVANVKIQGDPIEVLAIMMTAANVLIDKLAKTPSDKKKLAQILAKEFCESVEWNARTTEVHTKFDFGGGNDE